MSLRSHIVEAQKDAMKSKESEKLSVLRLLYAAIRNLEIDKGSELQDDDVLGLIRQQVKQLSDAAKEFEAGGRPDLVEKNNQESSILKQFLPAELSDEEITKVVQHILSQKGTTTVNVGQLMSESMKELKGKADGSRIRLIVEQLLKGV